MLYPCTFQQEDKINNTFSLPNSRPLGNSGLNFEKTVPILYYTLYTDIEYFTDRRHLYCIITSNVSVRWADTDIVLVKLARAKCGWGLQVNNRCSVDSSSSPSPTAALHTK